MKAEMKHWDGEKWIVDYTITTSPVTVADEEGTLLEGEALESWNERQRTVVSSGKRVTFLEDPELWLTRLARLPNTYTRVVLL